MYILYLLFVSIIIIYILVHVILKHNIHKKEIDFINYRYLSDNYKETKIGKSYTVNFKKQYTGINNYVIPHNNLYQSFVITLLIKNYKNINNLKKIIFFLRPDKIYLSHLLRFTGYQHLKSETKFLLDNGADPNIEIINFNDFHYKNYIILNPNKRLPVFTHIILASKQYKTIKLILESGRVDFSKCNKYYITPLMAAVLSRKVEMIKLLLKYDPENINFHQFYIEPVITEPTYFHKLIPRFKTFKVYDYINISNLIYQFDEINGEKVNLLQLLLLLNPSFKYIDDLNYDLNKIQKQNKFNKKIKNKFKPDNLCDILDILIKHDINLNFSNTFNLTTFNIICQNLFGSKLGNPIKYHETSFITFNPILKKGLYTDNIYIDDNTNFLRKLINYIDVYENNHTKLNIQYKNFLVSLKKHFISSHKIDDLCLIQLITEDNKYKISIDLTSLIIENLDKIRYNKFINKLLDFDYTRYNQNIVENIKKIIL